MTAIDALCYCAATMTKALAAGGEVDSWCTKCKMMLNHRIIAMEGGVPARVECSTCNSHHNFRARAPGEKAPAKERVAKTASAGTKAPRGAAARGKAAAEERAFATAREQQQAWEKAIAGRSVHEFRTYKVSEIFEERELVKHNKFGDGVVVRVIDPKKVEVLFKDGPLTLAQAMQLPG